MARNVNALGVTMPSPSNVLDRLRGVTCGMGVETVVGEAWICEGIKSKDREDTDMHAHSLHMSLEEACSKCTKVVPGCQCPSQS